MEPAGLQPRFWGLQKEQFWPAKRAFAASEERFKETFRCHRAQIRLTCGAVISTATDRGSSSTNQMHCRLDYFSTCLGSICARSAGYGALRFWHHLSAKTHRRAFGTAKLACKWPLGALWPAAALLGPAQRAFLACKGSFCSFRRAIQRDISVSQSSISLSLWGFDLVRRRIEGQ